jgi:RNA polymerase sigma-70 factor (ECF subfamily)
VADREQLERAFRTLTTEQRAAIVLQYYRGLTLDEIAVILRVPSGTVRSRLHYAKRALRAAIEADARQPAREGRPA